MADDPVPQHKVDQHNVEDFSLAEFQASGLLYLANTALHPFGFALAVEVGTDGSGDLAAGEVDEHTLRVVRTTDPAGFWFDEATHDEARRRLFRWLREHHVLLGGLHEAPQPADAVPAPGTDRLAEYQSWDIKQLRAELQRRAGGRLKPHVLDGQDRGSLIEDLVGQDIQAQREAAAPEA